MEGDAPIWEYGRSPVREGVGTAMHTDHTVARTRKRNWPNPNGMNEGLATGKVESYK
jgi:hypothetical protein